MAKKNLQADEVPAVDQIQKSDEVPAVAAPTRADLDSSMAALPGENDDPEYVVGAMRQYFGDLFTADDETTIREIFSRPVAQVPTVEAFLLRDCGFGPAGAVVLLTESDARAGKEQGMLDLHPDAIKAAKGE